VHRPATWGTRVLLLSNLFAACTVTEGGGRSSESGRIVELAQAALPAVVRVHSAGRMAQGSGAGFFWKNGAGGLFVITSHHVVWGASEIHLEMNDGTRQRAEVVGADAETDLATLRPGDRKPDQRSLSFGSDEWLRPGDSLVAIGSPGGIRNAVTTGILSARGKVPEATTAMQRTVDYLFVETVAAAGGSGGPVLATDGRVVGVNTAAVGGAPGLAIVLPGRVALRVAETLTRK
jgi:serine protease Do